MQTSSDTSKKSLFKLEWWALSEGIMKETANMLQYSNHVWCDTETAPVRLVTLGRQTNESVSKVNTGMTKFLPSDLSNWSYCIWSCKKMKDVHVCPTFKRLEASRSYRAHLTWSSFCAFVCGCCIVTPGRNLPSLLWRTWASLSAARSSYKEGGPDD